MAASLCRLETGLTTTDIIPLAPGGVRNTVSTPGGLQGQVTVVIVVKQ